MELPKGPLQGTPAVCSWWLPGSPRISERQASHRHSISARQVGGERAPYVGWPRGQDGGELVLPPPAAQSRESES